MRLKNLSVIITALLLLFALVNITGAENDDLGFYEIGVNDILEISVIDYPHLKSITTVSADGSITFPMIGNVRVNGMSVAEIEQEITERLSDGYINFPVVSISLSRSLSKRIYTYGAVYRRGEIPFLKGMTILNALSLAGGILENGQFGDIKVKRKLKNKSKFKEFNIGPVGIFGKNKNIDMLLENEDVLIVEQSKTFLIQGEVARRGRFILENNMTVLRALLEAGGITNEGLFGKVIVRRRSEEDSSRYKDFIESKVNEGKIENKTMEDTVLKPDDIVIVERNKSFLVQGMIGSSGRFVLENNMTVLKALLVAGGVSPDGLHGKIIVRRKSEKTSGKYENIRESELIDGVIESSEMEDTILQPDDIIFVERNKTFFIYGEANKIGEFALRNNMTVFRAITIAGGFTKWGSDSSVKILRLQDDNLGFATIKVNVKKVIDGDDSADVKLNKGDIIVISAGIF